MDYFESRDFNMRILKTLPRTRDKTTKVSQKFCNIFIM